MERVAIIGGCRTAFVKAGGKFADLSFIDLGAHVLKGTVRRLNLNPGQIDEFVFSTVLLDGRAPNFAREILFRTDLPKTISCHSVSNNCISGLLAISLVADAIKAGRIKLGLAGGAESMSNPALAWNPQAEKFFLSLFRSQGLLDKIKIFSRFRPGFMIPQPPSPKEPSTGLTMGEHCELMAKEFNIPREPQDNIAFLSHQRAAAAGAAGVMAEEIEPLNGVSSDNIIRADTSLEKLSRLKPVFDRSGRGTLTAGNSSPLTDGASLVCLSSESFARRNSLEILAFLDSVSFAAVNPADGLLMAPAVALPRLLKGAGLSPEQIDFFEVHEAFAAQVLANLKAWENGWPKYPDAAAIGPISLDRINLRGGSIAIGHPFAATGGRLLLSSALELKRSSAKRAAISICAAGAMAGAALVSRA